MSIEAGPQDFLVVLVTCPPAAAAGLATGLVEARLAACVSIVPGVESVYRWQGVLERSAESQLIVKLHGDRFADACDYVRAHHPSELPEIIGIPVRAGLPDYLRWIHTETR